jgi:hypothetical protein
MTVLAASGFTLKRGGSSVVSRGMAGLTTTSKAAKTTLIILPVFLFGCETCSLTMTEERRPRMFESRVLRRIFGPK